jgi:hypothetical protein
MPAFLLVARVGRLYLPFPWFLLWMILLPLSVAAWVVGETAHAIGDRRVSALRMAPAAAWALTLLHGLRIDIRSEAERIYLAWI